MSKSNHKDILSKKERSKRMSLIRGKWTQPEKWLHNFLKGNKMSHKMHPNLNGSPDAILPKKKIAIFVHGCFWHKCPKCYNEPAHNKKFWKQKAKMNTQRDKRNQKDLAKNGWSVITIWEHQITRHNPSNGLKKIISELRLR